MKGLACALALLLFGGAGQGRAADICTLVMDAASGAVIIENGSCDTRMTPASTFKIALAVIGFDAGILKSARDPAYAFRNGDPDWGGRNWTRTTNPRDWMRFSVVWYSQRLTHALGADTLARYARDLGFGNADFTGDAGQANGLDRAWLSSSLEISPREQAAFLRALVRDALPVSPRAMAAARDLLIAQDSAGWQMFGKTGGAYPRAADGTFDRSRGIGWYVGWAMRADEVRIFVRLTQATTPSSRSPGPMTRDAFLADWPALSTR